MTREEENYKSLRKENNKKNRNNACIKLTRSINKIILKCRAGNCTSAYSQSFVKLLLIAKGINIKVDSQRDL